MISNHYPMIFNHEYNWLVLMVIFVITAAIRQYFVAKHKGTQSPLVLVGAVVLSIVLAVAIAPKSAAPIIDEDGSEVHTVDLKVNDIITSRCTGCHSSAPTDDIFKVAQGGVILDNLAQMSRWAPRIKARAVDAKDMPFMNKTKIEDDERNYIALWIAQGAPVK